MPRSIFEAIFVDAGIHCQHVDAAGLLLDGCENAVEVDEVEVSPWIPATWLSVEGTKARIACPLGRLPGRSMAASRGTEGAQARRWRKPDSNHPSPGVVVGVGYRSHCLFR